MVFRSSDNFENLARFLKLSDDNLSRETDGNNEICLGVRFALCIIKALRLAHIEHCSGTVVTRFLFHSLFGCIIMCSVRFFPFLRTPLI